MSKKEGQILRIAIKAAGKTVEEFATLMGYSNRTSLNYQLGKEKLDHEVKENAAAVLGTTIDELFEQTVSSNDRKTDSEKETLRDLVIAQKQIIAYQQEFIVAQSLRNEGLLTEILYKMVKLENPGVTGQDLLKLQEAARAAAEGRIKTLPSQMMAQG